MSDSGDSNDGEVNQTHREQTNKSPFEWTEEICLKLIKEYRDRPMLWDSNHKLFYKFKLKMKAWADIGLIIGQSAENCRNKMVILQSSFRREKAKIINRVANGANDEDVYRSTWFAFEAMAFLMDRDNLRVKRPWPKKTLVAPPAEEYLDDSINEEIKAERTVHDLEIIDSYSVGPEPTEYTQTTNPLASRRDSNHESNEEIKSFLQFIGYKMKKYDIQTKNSVQHAICDIIFKTDQKFFRKRKYSSGSD